jgi:hypothetical protein
MQLHSVPSQEKYFRETSYLVHLEPALARGKNGNSILHSIKRVSAFALPVIALVLLESIPKAEGGPITYAGCVAGCRALGGSAAAIQNCIYACLPFLSPAFL